MQKIVVILNDYGFTHRIDVPESCDFRVGNSVEHDYKHAKIIEIKHDLDDMVTYFICK